MIQELLGGVVEDRKISIPSFATTNSSISSPSQSAASSPSSSSADAQQQQQNLRCPRCDSSNTKFCYYNNYNLTQPRHFCKTCRRYWTKGGALRNVPIGGGCRKTKPAAPSIVASNGKSGGSNCKTKPMASLDIMGRVVGLGGGGGLDHHHGGGQELLPSSPILWATSMPHSSHLLALLRASQMQQNHNPNPTHNHITPSLLNSIRIKDEGLVLGGAQVMAEPNCGLNAHSLGLDHLGQLPIGSCSSSLWKNENQFHYQQQVPQQQNLLLSEGPTSSGIQELYQRLSRSSSTSNNYCNSDHLQVIANNVTSCYSSAAATTTMASTTTASIMEPIPLAGGDFGYWNPAMSWPDLSTTNGAFP